MELWEEGDYIYRYTVTTRVTPALRWAAMRAIFSVTLIVRDKVIRQCPQNTVFEEKGDLKRIRTDVRLSAYQPNSLPLG